MQAIVDLDAPLVFPPAQVALDGGQQTPPLAPFGGEVYSPNSNPFGKRPATRTPAGSSIAAWRRVSGGPNSDLPEVPDFGSSPGVLMNHVYREPAHVHSHLILAP